MEVLEHSACFLHVETALDIPKLVWELGELDKGSETESSAGLRFLPI